MECGRYVTKSRERRYVHAMCSPGRPTVGTSESPKPSGSDRLVDHDPARATVNARVSDCGIRVPQSMAGSHRHLRGGICRSSSVEGLAVYFCAHRARGRRRDRQRSRSTFPLGRLLPQHSRWCFLSPPSQPLLTRPWQ